LVGEGEELLSFGGEDICCCWRHDMNFGVVV